jgi:hypothetical protein
MTPGNARVNFRRLIQQPVSIRRGSIRFGVRTEICVGFPEAKLHKDLGVDRRRLLTADQRF